MQQLNYKIMASMAVLLDYPTPQLSGQARAVADHLQMNSKIWQDLLEAFALHVSLTPFSEVEETYTQAFDMNPSCSLEIGWHLFGETYKRGSFMANMRASLRTHGVEEGTSLPDFLPNLLRLLPKLSPEDARGLVSDCILPSLAKIRPKLEQATPYDLLLESLDLMLQELAPLAAVGEIHACQCGDHAHTHGPINGTEVNHAG